MFNDLSAHMGKKASWTKHTLLGKSLLTHYNEGNMLTAEGTPSAKMMVRGSLDSHHSSAPGVSTTIKKDLDVTVTSGKDLYLAWNLSVASGTAANGAQALAVDNVEITALSRGTGMNDVFGSNETLNVTVTDGCLHIIGDTAHLVHVYSFNGSQVATATNTNEVNLPSLARGIYVIKVVTPTQSKAFKVRI